MKVYFKEESNEYEMNFMVPSKDGETRQSKKIKLDPEHTEELGLEFKPTTRDGVYIAHIPNQFSLEEVPAIIEHPPVYNTKGDVVVPAWTEKKKYALYQLVL